MKAFDGTWQRFEFSRNPLDNTMGGMGQWIKATFAEEVTISRFAWLNRGGNRDIKDVTFQFSDESTQTATLLKRTNDKPGCLNVNFAGSGSCAMSFTTPVKTTSVKVTVDSVYPCFDTYWGRYYDGVNHKLGYMGAYNIKFWGTAPSKVEALKDQPDGFKICSVAEGDGGEIKFGHECKGMMLNPLVNFENVGSNNVQEFGGDAAVFAELGNEPGVRILSSMSTVCTLTGSEAYLRLATDPAGVYYKHDPTLEFVDNVLENPKPVPKGWDKARRRRVRWETPKKGCVTVPKTYQNKDTCYLQPSCRDEDQSGAGLVTGGAGGWGGTCECPDGQQFEVGDNWDACRSLACEGGKMINCNRHWNSKWAGRRVNCNRKGGVQMEVCGSLGEVANDAATGRIIALQAGGPKDGRWGRKNKQDLFRYFDSRSTKHMVWLNIALDAPDTFRQRAAWALSQIWTCAGGTESSSDSTEHWAQYYDIFVRNTFGNVRNILKEVTYSPVMMLYLTYKGNKGFAKTGVFPDENMAREMMQLFTIGLYELESDGRAVLDEHGDRILSYGNEHIMSFARIWTGFNIQSMRGNIDTDRGTNNQIDPIKIVPEDRDTYPKTDVDGNFIGDKYPLCSDTHGSAFLRKGSKYVMTKHLYPGRPISSESPDASPHMTLSAASSALYLQLCGADEVGGACQFRSTVTLSADIICEGSECNVDTLSVVRVVNNDGVVQYYKYVPAPCVTLTYFAEGRTIRKSDRYGRRRSSRCADPRTATAGAVCCNSGNLLDGRDVDTCHYKWEKMTYSTMEERCKSLGKVPCGAYTAGGITGIRDMCASDYPSTHYHSCPEIAPKCVGHVSGKHWGKCKTTDDKPSPACEYQESHPEYAWTKDSCSQQVFILHDGNIYTEFKAERDRVPIHVKWADTGYPAEECDSTPGCEEVVGEKVGDNPAKSMGCVCDVTEVTKTVFHYQNAAPPHAQVAKTLQIGAHHPDAAVYAKCTTTACTSQAGVEVFLKKENGDNFDEDTIFKVLIDGKVTYLFNKESSVFVGTDSSFSFRNPPSFYASSVATTAEVEYEMEAYIDHLLHHHNTAPFLSHLLIQRLVTSNPSPRYVKTVADAFRSGTYDGTTYSGVYGDLEATFHAILLDREARSPLLDADPTAGAMREPLLKVVHSMKALEYEKNNGNLAELTSMHSKIGQQFNTQPSVFGFFQPDHYPDGPIGHSSLFAPEEQLSTGPYHIGYLNGMISFVKYGLSNYNSGFGPSNLPNGEPIGKFTYNPSWVDTQEMIDKLDLLLTGGRLSSESRIAVKAVADAEMLNANGDDEVVWKPSTCSASTHHTGWECHKAAIPGESGGWAIKNRVTWTNIGQWIKINFSNEREIKGFAWQNRGHVRDIKGVTLTFSDETTQTSTLGRWSRRRVAPGSGKCNQMQRFNSDTRSRRRHFTQAESCYRALTPVWTDAVKITVDSVYWVMYRGQNYTDFGDMGAYEIKFWATPPHSQEIFSLPKRLH